jgi:hypothetical protein
MTQRDLFSSSTATLQEGATVCTAEGESLGKLKEVHGAFFKVSPRLRPGYWLSSDCVIASTDGQVTVNFSKGDLSAYKLGAPGSSHGTVETPSSGDAVLSHGEQDEQRERMERELEEQRRNLSNN